MQTLIAEDVTQQRGKDGERGHHKNVLKEVRTIGLPFFVSNGSELNKDFLMDISDRSLW